MFAKRFLYNADGGGSDGGGDGQAADNTAGSASTATGGGTQAPGQDGAGTQSGNDDQTISLTEHQKELNRIAGKTRKEALAAFAKELGLDDEKALEAIVKAKKEADDKTRSDLDRANEAKTAAEKREQEAIAKAKNALLRAAFDREGVNQVEDLDSAFVVAGSLGMLGDESGLEINLESARVDGMDKVIKKLIETKPLFKKSSQAVAAGTGGAERGTTARAELTPEQEDAERRRRGIRPRRQAV
jgi:hypothetical protein